MAALDITGQRFGKLTVTGRSPVVRHGSILWRVHCDCGNNADVVATNLRNGNTKSCGCGRGRQAVCLKGKRFGRLLVVSQSKRAGARIKWLCSCSCGNTRVVDGASLRSGHTKSCGCARGQHGRKHGRSRLRCPTYEAWNGMKARCFRPTNKRWKNYGGRGITVCDRWRTSFEAFLADMGERPSPRHSLDRRDVNGNYEPGNCRWATAAEQRNNQRLSAPRVLAILTRMKSESVDLLEQNVLDRVRVALLGV